MTAKFISSAIFVKDIQTSRHFYEDVLNQKVDIDFGLSVGYIGGFSIWQGEHAYQTIFGISASDISQLGAKNFEFCFEVDDLDDMLTRVTQANVTFVHPVIEQPWGQRVFRVSDPDGHIVEFGEPMSVVIHRYITGGMSVEDAARRTGMPLEIVAEIAKSASNLARE